MAESREELDVLIVGAGLSGIGAAWAVQTGLPDLSYAVLEAREGVGGTWDLFRYPGIRSDSDMHTLGFSFRPWTDEKAFADGPTIRRYVEDTAAEFGIDRKIRFRHRLVAADWRAAEARWIATVEVGPERERREIACRFLYLCTGYYDYAAGHQPTWPETDRFEGALVHPQAWPQDLDWTDKRVLVIGSGATAVTLIPAMAERAAHVTMLQRSPTYVVARPAKDPIAARLRAALPRAAAHALTRWKNVLLGMVFYNYARLRPGETKRTIAKLAREALGPDYDLRHFSPAYDPWDQRLCVAPDGDLFAAIRSGKASVETDEIERFSPGGVVLKSGREIAADVIVSATGLKLLLGGGATLTLDGAPLGLSERLTYKGLMFDGVPNLAFAMGYTNASWTLKCELSSRYVVRLLKEARRRGAAVIVPERDGPVREEPAIGLSSGYVRRALDVLPKQGDRAPWRLHQNYLLDLVTLRFGRLQDRAIRFLTVREAA